MCPKKRAERETILLLLILLLLFGYQTTVTQISRTEILSPPLAAGQYAGASNGWLLKEEALITYFPKQIETYEVISLRKILKEVNADPLEDLVLAETYHKEGCFEFLSVLFYRVGVDIQSALREAQEVPSPQNGDIVKIEHSTYYGLPHWGIFLDGLVYHNWNGYRAETFSDFLQTYMLPGSSHLILRPSYHLSSVSSLVFPR